MREVHRDPAAHGTNNGPSVRAVPAALLALFLLCLALFPSAAAAKSWEGIGTFGGVAKAGETSEQAQLNGVSGLAVNYTGAGGVPVGTVYAVTHANGANRVARFTPDGDGLKFVERWDVVIPNAEKEREEKGKAPYKVCGPAVGMPSEGLTGELNCEMSPGGSQGGLGIAVDQATGNVYVGDEPNNYPAGELLIHVYAPNGASVIARFGEKGPIDTGKHEAETPNQIHSSTQPGWLAVNDDGEVYVFDLEASNTFYHRLMVFKPKVPGNYTAYEYAGQSADIGAGFLNKTNYLEAPVVDEAGNIYVKGDQTVEEYDPATPKAPICSFAFPPGAISALTVDPKTGEPFFFSYRKKSRFLYELSSCSEGHFTQTGKVEVKPERSEIYSLGFDPTRQFAGREPGAVYAGAAGAVPIEGKGEPGTSGLGYTLAQPKELPPLVLSESVGQVGATSAALQGEIDPNGHETQYTFQYVTEASYLLNGGFAGAAEAGGVIAGSGPQRVIATVASLDPDTTYVFRLVATSHCSAIDEAKECTKEGQPLKFHTYPLEVPGLPDNRAYELVSPAQKQGGQVLPANPNQRSCAVLCKPNLTAQRFPVQSTPDGSSVVYEGEPFGTEGALIENEYLSRRSGSGWTTTDLAPALLTNGDRNGYRAFSPTLDAGVFGQGAVPLSSSALSDYRNMYAQPTGAPSALTPVLDTFNAAPTCLPGSEKGSLRLTYVGASTDLSRLFFEANDALTPDAVGACEESNLYEWSAGALRAVNIPAGGTQSLPKAVFGSGQLLRSGNPNSPSAIVSHAISEDGRRAFFTGADGRLYARVDGATTIEVPSPGNCNAATPAAARVCFLSASTDGTHVLLSNGQTYALNGEETAYEADVDLTAGNGGFVGLSGQSEDLSHLYFVDTAILTGTEENSAGAKAVSGQNNLYARVDGTTRFVAVLAAADGNQESGDWTASPVVRTAEASPDGRWLAFQSSAELTGIDNVGPCVRSSNGAFIDAPCTQAFIYDSQSQTLSCASCNPSGSHPIGPTTLTIAYLAFGYLPQPRYLTDDGRLYFDSGDRLALGDSNGRVEDVYQYEPTGVGDCTRPDHCVSLISSGHGRSDSNFLTMDEGAENVFFTTRDQLARADRDELIDLYDARVGGGFPGETEIPARECEGESCQPPIEAPREVTPSSSSFNGPGNLREAGKPAVRCKGKQRKVKTRGKVRCAKPKKGKHTKQKHSSNGQPRRAHR
jgi:hypothetical protein